MSAKPYFDEEVEAARAHLATVSQLDAKSGDTIAVCRDIERRWLATVDALKARLAAAEAERDDARRDYDKAFRGFQQVCFAMTGTSDVASFMDALKPHDTAEAYAKELRERCAAAEARAERAVGMLRDARDILEAHPRRTQRGGWMEQPILQRIAALLKEVSHGQQG